MLRLEEGWHNSGYVFPEDYRSTVNFRSSTSLELLCIHECSVIGREGQFWPLPTFKVVAKDKPDEPIFAQSCTGCWRGVLNRIRSTIADRRIAGEDLPPPPKTAIAGPEYFGFNQAEIQEAIEGLDIDHACKAYWHGKALRTRVAASLPVREDSRARLSVLSVQQSRKRYKRNHSSDEETSDEEESDSESEQKNCNKWSALSRHERYRKRNGGTYVDSSNPLPGWMDPITMDEIVVPAISPYGHILGSATWKAVLSTSSTCPYTKQHLTWEQCQILTKGNLEKFRGRIIADDQLLRNFGLF